MIFEGLGVHPHSPPRPSVKSLPIEFGTSDALPSTQAVVKEETAVLGQPLKRVEDPKFITGTGLFADDIALPEVLHSVFVRSLYAHARIKRVDVTEALKQPAVRLVLTGQDLLNRVNKMPTVEEGGDTKPTDRPVLPVEEVNFAGEAIALVVADDVYSAEDASELVQVEYESLPAVVDMERAASPGSPRVHEYLKDNIGYRSTKSSGDVTNAFREADHVIKLQQEFPRLSAVPMEPRNVIASYEEASGFLTVWLSTQAPHEAREDIAGILRLPETKVRVIAPDMGGGFGQKGAVFPEYATVCFAAMKLGRSVKWVETRGENLTASSHGRGQKQFIEAAVRKDGRILGLKARIICNGGAYSDWNFSMPDITIGMAPGVYDIPAFKAEAVTVFTNEPPIGAYRGAGRPEATYLIERTVDVIARRLKLDPVKVRLKNYVPKSKFPYKSAGGNTYDSGDYEGNLRRALELSRYDELRDFQREARAKGRLVGIGVVTYVEVCGFGPDLPQTASVAVSRSCTATPPQFLGAQ
ncbi:MAG: xanthine dehydrogenase family protein molybdopterin-binding subunit [Thaumarchaeota archaeon]|nr:MAG: xanthine dehydrogenase family protein molybdopterin-binding subunit [Nitrososphaerota archaeon]